MTQVAVRETPLQHVVFRAATSAHTRIGATLAELLPAVMAQLPRLGLEPAGPPYARYAVWRERDCDVEAGIPVLANAAGHAGTLQVGTIGGMTAAVAQHVGPYDGLHTTYQALERWIAGNGYAVAGPPWEIYVDDPTEVPAAELRTDVYQPVRKR